MVYIQRWLAIGVMLLGVSLFPGLCQAMITDIAAHHSGQAVVVDDVQHGARYRTHLIGAVSASVIAGLGAALIHPLADDELLCLNYHNIFKDRACGRRATMGAEGTLFCLTMDSRYAARGLFIDWQAIDNAERMRFVEHGLLLAASASTAALLAAAYGALKQPAVELHERGYDCRSSLIRRRMAVLAANTVPLIGWGVLAAYECMQDSLCMPAVDFYRMYDCGKDTPDQWTTVLCHRRSDEVLDVHQTGRFLFFLGAHACSLVATRVLNGVWGLFERYDIDEEHEE